MFNVDSNITDLNIKDKNVLRILFSMNIHRVATPEGILEDARTYIAFFREGGEKISAFIELLLLQTNRKLFYTCSSNPFFQTDMNLVEEEARSFAEGLGAMLDEVDMTKMSQEGKNRWIEEHNLLIQKPAPAHTAETQTETPQGLQPQAAFPVQQAVQTPPAPEVVTPPQPSQSSQAPQAQPALTPVQPVYQPPPIQHMAPPPPQAPQPQAAVSPLQQVYQAPPIQQVTPAPHQPPQAPQSQPAVSPAQPVYQAPPIQPIVPQPQQPQQPEQWAAQQQQKSMQQTIKATVTKSPKHALKKETQTVTGVVSRDREALARLLTSF